MSFNGIYNTLCSKFDFFESRPRFIFEYSAAGLGGGNGSGRPRFCCAAGGEPVLVRMASGALYSVPEQSDDPAGARPLGVSPARMRLLVQLPQWVLVCLNVWPGVGANSHGVASKALPVVSCADPMCVRRKPLYLSGAMSGAKLGLITSKRAKKGVLGFSLLFGMAAQTLNPEP